MPTAQTSTTASRPEDLATVFVQILKANPWLTPAQVLEEIAGPVHTAIESSPDLKQRLLAILESESNHAALARFQSSPTDPALQQQLLQTVQTSLQQNTALSNELRDRVTEILQGQKRSLTWQIATFGIVLLAIAVSIVVYFLVTCPGFRCQPLLELPDSISKQIFLPGQTAGDTWEINALAATPVGIKPLLLVAAQHAVGGIPEYRLFQIDTNNPNTLDPIALPIILPQRVERMTIDCHGNAWLILHLPNTPPEVRVLQADGTDSGIRLNPASTNNWISRSANIFAVQTVCAPAFR